MLYQDSLVMVLDKPAGLPVHGGPAGDDNLESHLGLLRFGYKETPALAHRLDRDTAGCLILGRNHRALRKLGRLFEQRKIRKTYWAVVTGAPTPPEGIIDRPIKKLSTKGSGWRMVTAADGQRAVSAYQTLGRSDDGLAWLELNPRTGRTHQIRVHCAAVGCPIMGDEQYGTPGPTLHLLARAIEIPLFEDRPPIRVSAPAPPHMQDALKACGWKS
ncbi:putative RNA pseudouridine synthase [Magnetospira sp. QH-2]|nr:putative RNA pseudouridine synthase [Magnetospira sp. QH-2]